MASIFTRIINGELPGRIIWDDDLAVAMVDIRPLHPGHVLVIPKEEIDHWVDLTPELTAHLMSVAHQVAKAQESVLKSERIGLVIAGFEVPHAHIHVVPVDSMSDLDFANADTNADPGDLDAMAETLRAALVADGHADSVPEA